MWRGFYRYSVVMGRSYIDRSHRGITAGMETKKPRYYEPKLTLYPMKFGSVLKLR
jgi:hypothetical protein